MDRLYLLRLAAQHIPPREVCGLKQLGLHSLRVKQPCTNSFTHFLTGKKKYCKVTLNHMRLASILYAQKSICRLLHTFEKREKWSARSITSHSWWMTDIFICLTINYWHKTRLPSEKQCESKSSTREHTKQRGSFTFCQYTSVPAANTPVQHSALKAQAVNGSCFKTSAPPPWISTAKCYISLQNTKVQKVLTTCYLPERKIRNASSHYKAVHVFWGFPQVYYLFLWKKKEKKIKRLF